ncbi:MAG TPA: HlyD family secretion protein [Candidatus Binatia bacterium]|nr:HlyD family secretion protein [Candidatus Binatia bacterium]
MNRPEILTERDIAAPDAGRRRLLVIGTVIAVAAVAASAWVLHGRGYESTEDAFVQADIVPIGPKVAGTVKSVAVTENQSVKAGDLLLEIDPADHEVHVAQARANFEAAKAGLASSRADLALTRDRSSAGVSQAEAAVRSAAAEAERATADVKRYRELFARDEISRQQLDAAEAAARSSEARADEARSRLRDAQTAPRQVTVKETLAGARSAELAQAKAALEQAELSLSYTRIVAPRAGKVTRKNVQPGQQVAVGAALLALVGEDAWVVANFKETQIARMKPGQPVHFRVDAYPGHDFTGRVDSVQSGTGSVFSLLPPENATGNFVKVVQRVPVKLVFDPKPDAEHPLVPGMSVVPKVDVTAEPAAR